MKKFVILFFSFFALQLGAQVNDWEKYAASLRTNVLDDGEIETEYLLPELHINFSKEELERIQIESILKQLILRVYQYAVLTSYNVTILNQLALEGRIEYRPAAKDYKMDQVKASWKRKLGDSGYYPEEN